MTEHDDDCRWWILKFQRGVKPLGVVRLRVSKSLRSRHLPYRVLGQCGFWLILGFAGNAWCNPTPTNLSSSVDRSSSDNSFSSESLEVQTENYAEKSPVYAKDLREISHLATDLDSTGSSLRLRDLQGQVREAEVVLTPETRLAQVNPASRFQSAPASGQRRCWQLPIAECSYSASQVRLSQPNSSGSEEIDPELGILRVEPIEGEENNELGSIEAQEMATEPVSGALDPDLGILRLEERTAPQQPPIEIPAPPRQPSVYLIPRIDYFQTSNIFSDINPVDDGVIRSGITLFYAPPLNPRTFLLTSIDANLLRYGNFGRFRRFDGRTDSLNYDELRLRAGIYHRFNPRMAIEVGWSNQKLFRSNTGLRQIFGGERFINDNSIRLELSRQDPIAPRLSLNTFYQFRLSLVDSIPDNRSRLLNSVIASLNYSISPQVQTGLDYQFTWSHFTQQERDDLYHQLVARVSYSFMKRGQINAFTGFSFGNSTDDRIDFNSFIFGIGVSFNLPLF